MEGKSQIGMGVIQSAMFFTLSTFTKKAFESLTIKEHT